MRNKSSLKELANKRDIFIGAAVNPKLIREDRKYKGLLEHEFNIFTPENAMKFWYLHNTEGGYSFDDADFIVNFAKNNSAHLRGHTLVWHKNLPEWVLANNSPQKVKKILIDHIQQVTTHFKGDIYAWDVINEAFNSDGQLDSDSFWLNNIGPEYIELAFKTAHDSDENAKLFYNEWGIETLNPKSDAVYLWIKELLSRHMPIHGIGFQFHISLGSNRYSEDIPDKQDMYVNFKRFSDLGLEIHITELDVQVQGIKGSREEKFQAQAKVYRDILETCLQIPNFKALIQWGVTDKDSWIPEFTGRPDAPLIFDDHYKPKPAYYALKEILCQ